MINRRQANWPTSKRVIENGCNTCPGPIRRGGGVMVTIPITQKQDRTEVKAETGPRGARSHWRQQCRTQNQQLYWLPVPDGQVPEAKIPGPGLGGSALGLGSVQRARRSPAVTEYQPPIRRETQPVRGHGESNLHFLVGG